jgi:hypothetical protein
MRTNSDDNVNRLLTSPQKRQEFAVVMAMSGTRFFGTYRGGPGVYGWLKYTPKTHRQAIFNRMVEEGLIEDLGPAWEQADYRLVRGTPTREALEHTLRVTVEALERFVSRDIPPVWEREAKVDWIRERLEAGA